MAHMIELSEEQYQVATALASEQNQTVEELMQQLLDSAWEQACAKYDAAFYNDAEWIEGAREALAEAESGKGTVYSSTEAFLAHLQQDRG